ncbi:bifunctional DNA-formamidopyrimidine glycosylase/DNA-(apurinic or apyrimidinic site) lyase [Nesterenkonia marinintestina]|uniref:bifunctional DNA-formamidopyrimidine glycosylase/DNA-(apurinic or apyrimidinic site) lyase n=1 Tax=Nesterenkonia marinintestina TaxID=2979865 RepID=UPI0021C040A5|nr:bifunctional DNA-formamidopyrimidine glycosylase/DNA-(apurinic or apyrimidinic site) lyase [Nesterenkonia sp. GX14115]
MPELPEVEVVRRGVDAWAAGRTVEQVTVLDARSLRRHEGGTEDFLRRTVGTRLAAPRRRGKFLWIPLEGPAPSSPTTALMIHLGMSGQVLMEDAEAPPEKHLKVVMDLSSAPGLPEQLRFVDQRIFGGLQLSPLVPSGHPSGSVPTAAAHIGADPLEPGADDEALFRALRRRRSSLKRALLDQTLISGIGNIYADEALWAARLHFARRTETLTRGEVARLTAAVREVMEAALAAGGTSFDSLYVHVNGASGYFDRSLRAYGRAGMPCERCGAVVRRTPFMGRSSFWCPSCQPRPRAGRW